MAQAPEYVIGDDGMEPNVAVLDAEDSGVIENPDGSADIAIGGEVSEEGGESNFSENLATVLEESEMQTIATDLLHKIELDKEARKKRDEQYQEGLKRTGMGKEAPGGAEFEGASKVVHPMLTEGCVDFAASAMRELFPPAGPVKTKIEGKIDKMKLELAQRQQRCLNWQLTEQMPEYPEELEQALTQVPMGGSQYMKFWQDDDLGRPTCEFVPIDDCYIPFAASSFDTASRITHAQKLRQDTFDERVENSFYRDITVGAAGAAPEPSGSAQSTAKIEGKEDTGENIDEERVVYEVNTYYRISADKKARRPYLISIDESSGKIVSIYRNWEEEDDKHTRLDWMVEYGFISWRGAYKLGLPHMIGGLSAAATGALRALLDAAHAANLPGFLRLKGARVGGTSQTVNPMTGVEVESSSALDDIRKIAMPLPYGQPSPVLFQLLGWLDQSAKGVVTTAEEKIKDATNTMPVGTALALIEVGAKVYSSIHARLHRSQKRALKIIARLNAKHLSTKQQLDTVGEVLAHRSDFAKPLAVVPVSDPNIYSDAQRFAQMQLVFGVAEKTPQMHDLYKVVKRMYELAKIPNIEEFLPEPKQPKELNPAAENTASMMGAPIIAFPEQDHFAHIEVHMRFATDPFLGGAPFAAKQSLPALMEHVKQHMGFAYAQLIYEIATKALKVDLNELLKHKGRQKEADAVLAAASGPAHDEMRKRLQPLGPIIETLITQIAALVPPMPTDPNQVAMAIATQEDKRKREETQGDQALEAAEIERKSVADANKVVIEEKKIEQKEQADAARAAQSASQHAERMAEGQQPGNQIPGA